MERPFRVVCRGSKLALAQAEIFRRKLRQVDATASVEVIIKETRGDADQSIPLPEIEGKDFFTKDIQDYLLHGQADFAVHSLKDVSGESFFSSTHFAIVEREDPRDSAIFNSNILDKIGKGDALRLGTSSPRRAEMATAFLEKVLPTVTGRKAIVVAESIRGNVDTRLQKLTSGQYDGVILACAGINRLLRADTTGEVAELLAEKRLMILPLLNCPPAPGQGAIVAETQPSNVRAVKALQAMNDTGLAKAVDLERKVAHVYGSGCHQKFGAIHVRAGEDHFIYAAGKDRKDVAFSDMYSEEQQMIDVDRTPQPVDVNDPILTGQQITLITSRSNDLKTGTPGNRIWVSETAGWFTLAERGTWVEGSLEGFGLEFNSYTIQSPIMSIGRSVNQVLN